MRVTLLPLAKKTHSHDEVAKYLAEEGIVRWVKLGDLFAEEYDACVDGRETNPGEILKIFDGA